MIRKLFISIFALFLFTGLYAQDITEPDNRLYDVYAEEQIQDWMQNKPHIIELKNTELNYGYEFKTMPEDKAAQFPELIKIDPKTKTETGTVDKVNESDFNLFLYKYKRNYNSDNFYRIGNTQKVLVIISHKKLADITNKNRNHD